MVTFHINPAEVATFLAILLRISIVLFMTPLFSSAHLPNSLKALASFSFSVALYLLPNLKVAPLPFEPLALVCVVFSELILGIIVGLTFSTALGAFQFTGELISFQMGFGFAQVADPMGGAQITVVSRWFQTLSYLIFLTVNGHHLVIRTIVESFQTIPIGGFVIDSVTYGKLIGLTAQILVIGMKLAGPVMVTLLLAHVALGLLSKFAPQLNVMTASFPLTLLLGFLFLHLSLSLWSSAMELYLAKAFQFSRGLLGL
jgi:flagellar biosynthesis protein FliR